MSPITEQQKILKKISAYKKTFDDSISKAEELAKIAEKDRERYNIAKWFYEQEYGKIPDGDVNPTNRNPDESSETPPKMTLRELSLQALKDQTKPLRLGEVHKKVQKLAGRKIGLNNYWAVLRKMKEDGLFMDNLERGFYQLKK